MGRIAVFAGILFVLLYVGWLFTAVLTKIGKKRREKREASGIVSDARQQRDEIWQGAESVKGMVSLYRTMVCKHGPDSTEAKAFRFGTDSPLMKSLHSEESAMLSFTQQADSIDKTWREQQRNEKGKKTHAGTN